MTDVYAGAAVLFFAIWGLRRRNRWRWYLAAVALLICCCCVGNQLPVRGWLYDFVIPTRYFRNAALLRCFFIFLLAVLAALGTRDLEEAYGRHRIRFFGMAGIVTAYVGVVVFAAVAHETDKRPEQYPIAIGQAIAVWGGLAVAAVLVQRRSLTKRALSRWFIGIALIDAVLSLVVSGPILYAAEEIPLWHAMNQMHRSSLQLPDLNRQLLPPFMPVVGSYHNNCNIPMRVSALVSYETMTNRFREYIGSDPAVSAFATGSQRIWFAPKSVASPISDPAFGLFVAQAHQHNAPVMFVHSPAEMQYVSRPGDPHRNAPGPDAAAAEATLATRAAVSDLRYLPNSLAFSYRAAQSGWLLVTDRWAPGWHVTVNGHERPNLAGDFIFRAVQVSPGLNVIQYVYNPVGFWPLTILSWAILAAYLGIECFRWLRRRSSRAPAFETAQLEHAVR